MLELRKEHQEVPKGKQLHNMRLTSLHQLLDKREDDGIEP
jgi:hypothetical protein